ncbi:hypothetical protein PAHAL_3G312100 [Panicum hallii]|nr:uncharacterized protein LOC112887064 isoform X2 [Panicum hallii]PAN19994.1 hypothetical protein PAHAL_3G312100 [Panicum hallii]
MDGCRASPAPASLPDNDDLLLEILLRLPPLPSSLPRASLVCKRWRRLLSDPQFLRRFRAHHRKPPMLGFFFVDFDNDDGPIPVFTPTLATPDRIPPARFSFPNHSREGLFFLECRHGLALLFNWRKLESVVWDPITGFRLSIAIPTEMKRNDRHHHFKCDLYNGAVMRNCCSGAFKVVTVFSNRLYKLAWACLYDSESGKWGNIISTAVPSSTYLAQPSVLVGNAVCWLLHFRGAGVLRFDTDKQSLDVIQMPEDIHDTDDSCVDLLRTADGGLGIAILSKQRIQLWGQTAVSDRVVGWVLQKTIELDKLISLTPLMETQHPTTIVGFDEDNNVFFLSTAIDTFMIQLESMKFTTLPKDDSIRLYYPYTSFYTTGWGIGGGDDRSEMLNNARADFPV